MRVLGISGSLRRGSYNTALLRHAGDLFEAEGAEFDIYHGLRDILACDEDYDTEDAPEAVSRLREAVRDADAVFFVTPEYNSSIAGERFDENGRLNEPNLEQELHEVVTMLLDDARSTTTGRPAADVVRAASRRRAGYRALNSCIAGSGSRTFNAATFSSRCRTVDVPGIGTMLGARCSNQASATWAGVAFSCSPHSLGATSLRATRSQR